MEDTEVSSGAGDARPTTVVINAGEASKDNPFSAGGELSDKAEYIIRHSTISRKEIHIVDPDSPQPLEPEEEIQKVESLQVNSAKPSDGKVQENGKVQEPIAVQSVEVEVGKASAKKEEPQQAEQVKLKEGKKCACCVVM